VKALDILSIIKERRSIRKFKKQEVPDDIVEKLIEAATWAPSAGNIQPWEFIIIRKPETQKKLSNAAYRQTFIEQAPVTIVVCANEERSYQRYGPRGKTLYCLQDTAAAAQNIHLTARSLGLGTCWVGAFNEEEVAKTIKTPATIRPIAIIPIGYPDEKPIPRQRRPKVEVVHKEEF
jgi:nitroreductase